MEIPPLRSIASIIAEYFSGGVHLGEDCISFAFSTLGIESLAAVGDLLTDPDQYGEGMFDLLFTPDEALSMDIEPMLPVSGLSIADIESIKALVLKDTARVRILFEQPERCIEIPLTNSLISSFLNRLNMQKKTEGIDLDNMRHPEKREWYIGARAMMRAMPHRSSLKRTRFIAAMIESLLLLVYVEYDVFMQCMRFILRLYGEIDQDIDIYAMISWKKQLSRNTLAGIMRFDELSRAYSMEYLMSHRIQPPPADVEELKKDIYCADLICFSVYGRTVETDWIREASLDEKGDIGRTGSVRN